MYVGNQFESDLANDSVHYLNSDNRELDTDSAFILNSDYTNSIIIPQL